MVPDSDDRKVICLLIRFAGPDDCDHIANLYVASHRETYKDLLPDRYFDMLTPVYAKEKWTHYLQESGSRIWVAYEDDRFLGFSAGSADKDLSDTWLLDSLHVVGAARGKGVGTALIRTNGMYAVENGFLRMSICIVRGNEKARLLYEKLGAEHDSFFDDDFCGTISHSEKLVWNHPEILRYPSA